MKNQLSFTGFSPQSYCTHEEWSMAEVFLEHHRIPHAHYLYLLLIQYHHHYMPMRRMEPREEQCVLVFLTLNLVCITSCPGQLQQLSTSTKHKHQFWARHYSFRKKTTVGFTTTKPYHWMARYKHHLWVQNVASAMTSVEQGLINSRIFQQVPGRIKPIGRISHQTQQIS